MTVFHQVSTTSKYHLQVPSLQVFPQTLNKGYGQIMSKISQRSNSSNEVVVSMLILKIFQITPNLTCLALSISFSVTSEVTRASLTSREVRCEVCRVKNNSSFSSNGTFDSYIIRNKSFSKSF